MLGQIAPDEARAAGNQSPHPPPRRQVRGECTRTPPGRTTRGGIAPGRRGGPQRGPPQRRQRPPLQGRATRRAEPENAEKKWNRQSTTSVGVMSAVRTVWFWT